MATFSDNAAGVQTAFSHLELALKNLSDQLAKAHATELDRSTMFDAALLLATMSSSSKLAIISGMRASDTTNAKTVVDLNSDTDIDNSKDEMARNSQQDHKPQQEPLGTTPEVLTTIHGEPEGLEYVAVEEKIPGESEALENVIAEEQIVLSAEQQQIDPGFSQAELSTEQRDLVKLLMHIFDEIDGDHSGTITHMELRKATAVYGFPEDLKDKMEAYDENTDGVIDKAEWMQLIHHTLIAGDDDELVVFMRHVAATRKNKGDGSFRKSTKWYLWNHTSKSRMSWDVVMMFLLLYIFLSLPLTFAWPQSDELRIVDLCLDWIFLADVMVNFFTTYEGRRRRTVTDIQQIACRYLKTWFMIDILSSLPLEMLTNGLFPRLQPLKVLKFGKVAKALKVIKLGKVVKIMSSSGAFQNAEEAIYVWHLMVVWRFLKLLAGMLTCGHWLACLLKACGGESLHAYLGSDTNNRGEYVAALYWSMMTMTTVGYGDIPMRTDLERIYAILCMIIGGGYYGYIVGHITSIISENDMQAREFNERMNIVMAWLESHPELPKTLKTRIWRHFKEFLTMKGGVEDHLIVNDLPPSLSGDVSFFLLDEDVRCNNLFSGMPANLLARLVTIIDQATYQRGESIVDEGAQQRCCMYIVSEGEAEMTYNGKCKDVLRGESFGEEMLVGFETRSGYSVKATTKVRVFRIAADAYQNEFGDSPELIETMQERTRTELGRSFLGKDYSCSAQSDQAKGRASLINGGSSGIQASFPEAVLDTLADMHTMLHAVHKHNVPAGIVTDCK